MDETMRIYQPRHSESNVAEESKWKRFFVYITDWQVWKNVFDENGKREHELEQKYQWFDILYNWIIALCVFGLFVSFIAWGINIYTERTAQAYGQTVAAQKDAEHQAYIDQQEADRRAAEQALEELMKVSARIKAKVGYGSRNFRDVYNYGEADFMTLYTCMDNRDKNPMYANMTVKEKFFTEGQFIAAYDTNPVQDYYFNIAMKFERLKYERESKGLPDPVGSDYIYAIYTPHGIFLATDPNAPAYTWWRYSE